MENISKKDEVLNGMIRGADSSVNQFSLMRDKLVDEIDYCLSGQGGRQLGLVDADIAMLYQLSRLCNLDLELAKIDKWETLYEGQMILTDDPERNAEKEFIFTENFQRLREASEIRY